MKLYVIHQDGLHDAFGDLGLPDEIDDGDARAEFFIVLNDDTADATRDFDGTWRISEAALHDAAEIYAVMVADAGGGLAWRVYRKFLLILPEWCEEVIELGEEVPR